MQTIMVADDHDETRELLVDVLMLEADWNVAAMPSGSALLNTAWTLVPDLVILDVAMPGIDGLATYQLLREQQATHNVPVLFVTANPSLLAGAQLKGPYDTLIKPFGLSQLISRVTAMLNSNNPGRGGAIRCPTIKSSSSTSARQQSIE